MTSADNGLFHKADSLFAEGHFFRSTIEYERILFEHEAPGIQREALIKKAVALKYQERYTEAIRELNRIAIRSPKDTLLAARTYHLAVCHCLNGNYQEALATIDMYEYALDGHPLLYDILIIKTLSNNHLFKFEDAETSLRQITELQVDESNGINSILKEIYDRGKTPRYRNPERAHDFSIVIPGSGHLYAGAFGEGAVNFLLNASALSFGVWQVYTGYYFTGYVVGVTFLERFHSGGKKRASVLAELKNIENTNKLNMRILDAIKEN